MRKLLATLSGVIDMDDENAILLIFMLFVACYVAVLIYLNSKVKASGDMLPEKYALLKTFTSSIGLLISGGFLLMGMLFAIGVIFFRDEFLPR